MHRLKAYFGVIFETWQARRSLGFKGDCSWGFARAAGGALRCVAFRTAPRIGVFVVQPGCGTERRS